MISKTKSIAITRSGFIAVINLFAPFFILPKIALAGTINASRKKHGELSDLLGEK